MKAKFNKSAVKAEVSALPQLHGRTKIELFDAQSGEKVYEQTDENMVTVALQRLLDLPAELTVMDNVSSRNCLPDLSMPFLNKALSGIWVFSKALPENAEYISPSTDDIKALEGFAGGEYSSANTKRGTLNTNESGAIDNGYRYVWDFATDKSNSVIKCVSLVPRVAGNLGDSTENNMCGLGLSMCDLLNYSTSDYQSGVGKISFQVGHYSSGDGLLASVAGSIMPIYAERTDENIYIYAVSSKLGNVYKFPIPNSQSLQITDAPGSLDLRYRYKLVWENTDGFTSCNAEYYDGNIYLWSCSDKLTSTLIKLSLTGEILSKATVTFDTELRTEAYARLYDPETEMWYAQPYSGSSNSIKVFDSNGTNIQTYAVSNSYCTTLTRMPGRKQIQISHSTSYSSLVNSTSLLLDTDGTILRTVRGGGATSSSSYIKQLHGLGEQYPYVLQGYSYANSYTSTNAHTVSIVLNRALPLLCSINNLSQEVIKTNAQTMKITYEITQG